MNIVCIICSENLTPSDDVFFTTCGHIFHFACLTQWLERSRTCPQCREKVTQNKIHRLYFNFSNNDTIVEDATTLQATVDSLKFQILIKERECKQAMEKYNKAKSEATGLRAEVRKLENERTHNSTAILAFKEQIKFLKSQACQYENAKKEVTRLQSKVEEYRSIQTLINAPSEDVDGMIANTRDPAKLLTYITVMKRELTTSVARRKELRTSLKQVQQDLTKVSMERNYLLGEREKRKELEEELMISEVERRSLEDRLSALENKGPSVAKSIGNGAHESTRSGPDVSSEPHHPACPFKKQSNCQNELPKASTCIRIAGALGSVPGDEENALRYTIKSNVAGGGAQLKRSSQLLTGSSQYALLAKKQRLAQTGVADRPKSEMCFDGFGGHSKNEKFPSPKLHNTEVKKPSRVDAATRKTRLDDGSNRKIGDLFSSDQQT